MTRRATVVPPLLLLVTLLMVGSLAMQGYGAPIALPTNPQASPYSLLEAPPSVVAGETPPTPNGPPDWIDVLLDVYYFYNDSVQVSWRGRPRTSLVSPYNPLYNWTMEGTIVGGVWPGNPGNATIRVSPKANYSASVVEDFLNSTMENYVRFTCWPSLDCFNFTQYENASLWEFEGRIASAEEFLNTTFHLVSNATRYLMDGFNVTGIIESLGNWRVRMQWNETDSSLEFSYTLYNATDLVGDLYIFRLSKAMGRTEPLTLTGVGTLTVYGPYDRIIVNATPDSIYANTSFPIFPIGCNTFDFNEEVEQDFDLAFWFRRATAGISISREVSATSLQRGQVVTVIVTVENMGDLPLFDVTVSDLSGILSGAFVLVEGSASLFCPRLESGESLIMEYAMMAVQVGQVVLDGATVTARDLLAGEHVASTGDVTVSIGSGLLASEVLLIAGGAGAAVALVVLLILARLLRRWRRPTPQAGSS